MVSMEDGKVYACDVTTGREGGERDDQRVLGGERRGGHDAMAIPAVTAAYCVWLEGGS